MAARKPVRKKLVIVESRAKAETLQKFLGRSYKVMASVGHVRDLPRSGLGVDIEHDFAPKYVVPRDKSKVVTRLRKAAADAGEVLLATDPDREGEAIAWHLRTAAKLEAKPVQRVSFHEITKDAVREAVGSPREIDQDLVEAQQARRILDRLVGYQISPLLNRRVQRGTSAGRVQSVALRLVVERDREIDAFEPREFWTIEGRFAREGTTSPQAVARLTGAEGDLEIGSESESDALLRAIEGARYRVESRRDQAQKRQPAAPFTTSTLQQAASSRLGMAPRRAMAIAQQLYEGVNTESGRQGLITYMRTDSTTVSAQAQREARSWIGDNFTRRHVPGRPPTYRSRVKNAQEAHEAIRPTEVGRTPDAVANFLDRDQRRLYELIWRRFVASQMAPAELLRRTAVFQPSRDGADLEYRFRAAVTETTFPGFLAVARPDAKPDQEQTEAIALIGSLDEGDPVDLLDLLPEQHFTEPPPRYTEATLVRKLEEEGIGRPSTYAPTVATLFDRDYVTSTRRRLESTTLGARISDLLVKHFPDIVDYGFTAQMEENLDSISRGELGWVPVLRDFYDGFAKTLAAAETAMRDERPPDEPVGRDCPESGHALVYKHGRYGRFIGCTGFPDCRYTERIVVSTGLTCPKCEQGEIVERRTRRGRTFWGCGRYPECDHATWKNPTAGRARGPGDDGDPAAVPQAKTS